MEETLPPTKSNWTRRILKALGLALLAIVLLCALALAALSSGPGRAFVKDQIEAIEFENGLKIGLGAIDGSLLGAMTLRDVTLSDPQGVFAATPALEVDWHPFALADGRIDIDRAVAASATFKRIPEFAETASSDAPLFPDYAIDIGELAIERLVIEAPVTGAPRIARLSGSALIEDARAQVTLDANSVASDDLAAAGDALALTLDAVPDDNRLSLTVRLSAPADGVISALAPWTGAMEATLEGKGDWARWDGRLDASLDGQDTAGLVLTARDGTFEASGDARIGRLVPASLARLFAGTTKLALSARPEESLTAIDASINTAAMTVNGVGGMSLGDSLFEKFDVDLRLQEPSALLSSFAGSGVRAQVTLDGALTRPDVDYRLTAAQLTTFGYGVAGLDASGKTQIDAESTTIPIRARAKSAVGLDTATGGPLTNVTLTGDILVSWPRILSDNLRLRSERLDANLTLLANAEDGRYGGAIEGELGDYQLASVGLFDVVSGAQLSGTTSARASLEGTVQARSSDLTNDGVRSLLGGDMVLSSDVTYGLDRVTRLSNIRIAGTSLTVEEGGGVFDAEGVMDITLAGRSVDYGPLGLELGGTIAEPVATVTASAPGFGVGLAGVTALVRGNDGRYVITADGSSDLGPFKANLTTDLTGERLALDLERGEIGGVVLAGRLEQSEAGPLIGDLAASGSGVSGTVQLSGEEAVQVARVDLRASALALPGAARLRVGRGIIKADVTLRDAPEIIADIQLSNARYFATSVDTLRAQVELADGTGTARVLATGRDEVPFRIAANADLTPELWRAAITGEARGVTFQTASPARIIPGEDGYELLPTKIDFNRGSMRLAGEFGEALALQARLDKLDLAILNRFERGLGINGQATGSLDFRQDSEDAFPTAEARFKFTGFSRSTALAASRPVDVNLTASLDEAGGSMSAVARQNGSVIGRLKTGLSLRTSQSGDWYDRLLSAPLSGGARYNGPSATMFSLAGLADQRLTGPLGVAVDFSGRLDRPVLDGIIRATALTYENETYGTQLSDMNIAARFDEDNVLIDTFTAQAGKGRVDASGVIGLSVERGFPMKVNFNLDNAQLAHSQDLRARATGQLTLVKEQGKRSVLSGTLTLPETRYTVRYLEVAEIPELTGVRFRTQFPDEKPTITAVDSEPGLRDLRLNLRLVADDELFVNGMGLESEWKADFRLTGTTADPRLSGEIDLTRGSLDFAGRAFALEEGRVRFDDDPSVDPQIAITATEQINDVSVAVNVGGSAFTPEFSFSSSPGLPQDEILSRILFGSSISNLSALEAVQLAQSLNALSGSGRGLNPLGSIRSATGIDRLRLLAADETNGRGTALAAGQYISDDIYVEVITDARGFTATQLELSLTPALSVLSQAGGTGETNVSVRYRKDY